MKPQSTLPIARSFSAVPLFGPAVFVHRGGRHHGKLPPALRLPPSISRLAVTVVVLAAWGASAALFHVGTDGDDTWTGSSDQPWATLQHAANSVGAGDTVLVGPGTYSGFQLTTSGTAAAPIWFSGLPGATISGNNPFTSDAVNFESVSHAGIKGFRITGAARAGVRTVGSASNHARDISVVDNQLIGNNYWGIFTGFVDDLYIAGNEAAYASEQHGIYVSNSGDRPVVVKNQVHHNQSSGIQVNADISTGGDGIIDYALIAGNVLYNNGDGGGAAINLDGVIDSRIENNLLYDNNAGGIAIFRIDGGSPSFNNQVVNNTIFQPAGSRWAIAVRNGSQGNVLLNNIVENRGPSAGAIDISNDSLAATVSDYNAVTNWLSLDGVSMDLPAWQSQTGLDAHSFTVDILELYALVGSLPGDEYFALFDDSAAVDAGTGYLAPAFDILGTPRPWGISVDIGAYEFSNPIPEPATAAILLLGTVVLLAQPRRHPSGCA